MDVEEELPRKWCGSPQPISFPIIKEEIKEYVQILDHSSDSVGDEINDLCSPSVINLDDSDDEIVENDNENTSVSSGCQQQYDTIDLTIDEDESHDGDYKHDIQNKESCGNEVSSSMFTQDNLGAEAEVCDRSCVIKPSFLCQSCNICYISQCSLYLTSLRGELNFLCTICMTLHENERVFCMHLKSHENRYISCQLCKEKSLKVTCSLCGSCFDSDEKFKLHQKTHSWQTEENDQLRCEVCKRDFVSKTLLEIHERLHTEELFKCNLCGGQFWTQQILYEHQEVCGSSNSTCTLFKCNLCPKNFHSQGLFNDHLRQCVNSKSQIYYCEMCPDLFLYASNLTVHILVHLNGKSGRLLECDCCDMKFFSTSGLAAHKYCTGKVAYSCSPCNLQFLLESVFLSHLHGFHSVKTVVSCNSKEQESLHIEKLRAADEITHFKDDDSRSNVTFQVKSNHNTTKYSKLQAKKILSNLNLSLSSSDLKNPIPDGTLRLQNDESQSGEKSLGVPKRTSPNVSRTDESSPAKVCRTSYQDSNCNQNNVAKNIIPKVSIIAGNNTPHSYPGSKNPGNDKNYKVPRKVPIHQTSHSQSVAQELHVIISPSRLIDSSTPRIFPKNNIASVQPRRRTVVDSNSAESDNVKKKQRNINAAIKPSVLDQVRGRTGKLPQVESHSSLTKADHSSEVFQKVAFENHQLSPNTNPALTISSGDGFADTRISQTLLIGSSQSLQSPCVASPEVSEDKQVSSTQPVPVESQSAIVPNNQASQDNDLLPSASQNYNADNEPNPAALQAKVAKSQSNENDDIYEVLPDGNNGRIFPGNEILRNKKTADSVCKQVKVSRQRAPQNTFKIKANSIIPAKLVKVCRANVTSPPDTSKTHLLSAETSGNFQVLPIAAVQALPVNNGPAFVVVPVAAGVSQVRPVSMPVPPPTNVSQPIIFKVRRKPNNTKCQNGLQETLIEVENLELVAGVGGSGLLKNNLAKKTSKYVSIQPRLVSHQHQNLLLPKVANYLLCEFCSSYFTDYHKYRMHKLSCVKCNTT